MKQLPILAAPVLLAACATTGDAEPGGLAEGPCKADAAQSLVGQKATADVGARLLKLTGAKTLRWGPPRSAMTMDFRPDRLTVSYDDNMVIDRISCG